MLVRLLIIFLLVVLYYPAMAGQGFFYKEINLIGGSTDQNSSVGFEYYKIISNEYGDYLTTDLQLRLVYDSSEQSADVWNIEIHNAWGEYKLGKGYKLRFGHFDPAFGLEPILDTHGTLLQTMAMKNIGFKKDWGIALKSYLFNYDYEIAVQMGSGMSIRTQDGNYLLSGRIGTSQDTLFQYGISFFCGELFQTEGAGTITKRRIGMDSQYSFGNFLFKGEMAYGENSGQHVLGYWLEMDSTLPSHQNWQFGVQLQSWINDLTMSNSDDSALILGVSHKISSKLTLSMDYSYDIHLMNAREDNKLRLQLYYYGS
jgi:hypothetical protein